MSRLVVMVARIVLARPGRQVRSAGQGAGSGFASIQSNRPEETRDSPGGVLSRVIRKTLPLRTPPSRCIREITRLIVPHGSGGRGEVRAVRVHPRRSG